jgi:hypothetical protein
MNEAAARRTLLVRAYESAPDSPLWGEDDRGWATRAAAQVEGETAADDAFIARRAALAVERLRTRERNVGRLLASVAWPSWLGWILPALALAAGFAIDAIGAGQRVNLLAPPLLALLAWNLAVYAAVFMRGTWALVDARARGLGPIARLAARLAHVTGAPPKRGGKVAAQFVADWMQASSRLTAARLARVLHASAAALALGALAGLYLRGIALEYRAGWESTFLDAGAVQALLAAVLGPAAAATGIALPDIEGYERLRFAAGGGANAAPWLHLYAVTLGAAVVLPRLLLALVARWREQRLATRFPLPLADPYYRSLLRVLRAAPVAVRVAPYGTQLSPQATLNLNALLMQTFGAEDDIDPQQLVGTATLLAPLFALTATPEAENHGTFVERLKTAAASARVVALIDEAAFRRQFGDAPRLEERRALWRRLAAERGLAAVFVDLDRPDTQAAQQALQAAFDAAPAP